ncbi:hypothetical protein KUM39_13435 [Streptomyces sp. J2-1]|uniref:MmyB family transcriptional regulator n=1 Tax=Streptomyces corallincola TaxID=2851888 RepID=UPI001C38BE6F|nr:hypothetical protein [Streptomyces corallincola]MBV2355361.1 hypothetical protein [Streptomyces corallincola]
MAHQAEGQWAPPPVAESPEARAYLEDYAALVDAVAFPSLVVDHRWTVVTANSAYGTLFSGVRPHPTAMPAVSFLRFVLFHPDAPGILGDHEPGWCLPMLAHLKTAVEHHAHDHELLALRREVAQDPIMEAAFRQGLPHWLGAVGERGSRLDSAVRLLRHPDPRREPTECRIVDETPAALREFGYTRLTMVLRDNRRPGAVTRRRRRPRTSGARLTVVPSPEN